MPNTLYIQRYYTEINWEISPFSKRNSEQDNVIVVPVIIRSTGDVPKNIHQSVDYLQLNKNVGLYIQLLQQAVYILIIYNYNTTQIS